MFFFFGDLVWDYIHATTRCIFCHSIVYRALARIASNIISASVRPSVRPPPRARPPCTRAAFDCHRSVTAAGAAAGRICTGGNPAAGEVLNPCPPACLPAQQQHDTQLGCLSVGRACLLACVLYVHMYVRTYARQYCVASYGGLVVSEFVMDGCLSGERSRTVSPHKKLNRISWSYAYAQQE